MSITHTACCVGTWIFERHTVWLKAGVIVLAITGRIATFPRKECRMCFPFCRDTLSWKKPCLSSKENCSLWMMNENVYSDMQLFCQGHETHCKISRQKNSSKTKLWENLMQFWCSFQNCIKTASKLHQIFQNFLRCSLTCSHISFKIFSVFFKEILSHKNGPRGYERCFHKFISTIQESTESFWKFHPIFSNVLAGKYQDSPQKLSYLSTVN